jgi:hypothetical protein
VRDGVRVFLIAACVLLLGSPAAYGSTGFAFLTTTLQVAAAVLILVATWDRFADRQASPWSATASAERGSARLVEAAIVVIGALLVFAAARAWLHDISISSAPGRMFHADVRIVALPGLLFVPVACALCASASAADGRPMAAAAWIALVAILSLSEPFRRFVAAAQTPLYWPLVALAAWFTARGWWLRAAVVIGVLLVVGYGTIAIAPILLMAAWNTGRRSFAGASIVVVAAAVVPLVWGGADGHALQIPMGGWHEAQDTIGLTGLLLRAGWPSAVRPVHLAAMLGVYAVAWFALKRGHRPLPWMGLALFTMDATLPRPAGDAWFDLIVFFLFAAVAETRWFEVRHTFRAWIATLAAAAAVAAASVWGEIPLNTDIDVGSYADRPFLVSGFADNEEAGRSFAWVEGIDARVLVPRRSRRAADLDIVCEPHLPGRDATQQMSVALNGVVLGTVALHDGWQTVTLPAPAPAWQIGVNDLRLSFTNAISPLEAGQSADPRRLSVAFDRITVRTR